VFCDYFTRWAIAVPTQDPDSDEAADAIIQQVYTKFGAPTTLISDNGPAFTANLTKKICERLSINKVFTTPYHPQANGLVERWNLTVLGMLRTLADDHVSDWEDHLDFAVFAYNSSVHPTLGLLPYFMNFGREPTIPLDTILGRKPDDTTVDAHVQQRLDQLDQSIKLGREAQEKTKRMSHQALVEKVNRPYTTAFKIGDHVFAEKADAKKLEERWEGPFEVLKVSKATVTLKYYGTFKQFHPSRLKFSKITPKDLTAKPVEEIEQDPDPNMDPRDLIGKRVRVWWPSSNGTMALLFPGKRKGTW